MVERIQKIPDARHPIELHQNSKRVVVTIAGEIVADTTRALALKEASYPVVLYIPREDVDMRRFSKSATQTWCPYKGEASYYSSEIGGKRAADAAWSYETPFPAVAAIAGCLAFYPGRVDAIEQRQG